MRVLVRGAGGQIGRAVARDCAARGWQVLAVSQSGAAAAELQALGIDCRPEAASRAELLAALGPVDAFVDPLAFTAEDAAALLALGPLAGQIVVISTASVYADDQGRGFETEDFAQYPDPIRETQALMPDGPGYSAGKAAMERAFGAAPVTILRPGAIHGPGARHPREFWFLKRALDGRRVLPLAQGGRTVFHTSSTAGIAGFCAHAIAEGVTGAFNIGDPVVPTAAEVAEAVAAHVGWRFTIVDPGPREDAVGASPLSARHPVRLALDKARATGWDGGPGYAQALPAYLDGLIARAADWQREFPVFQRYGHDPFDYAAEDAALGAG